MPFIPMLDYADEIAKASIDHRFGMAGAPPLTGEQQQRIAALREGARLYARHIVSSVPPSFERDQALIAIDNANSWAARSISRNEGNK